MKTRITITAIVAVLISALVGDAALAAGRNYVDKRRVIRSGVLVPGTVNNQQVNAAPHIFYIMGERVDLKPSGWTFENPLAAGGDMFKNRAAYWAVFLRQTTIENLCKFDLLYMSAQTAVSFHPNDRDKIRRFVDAGGCLWIDNAGGMTFPESGAFAFFLPGVDFTSSPDYRTPWIAASLHPLLTSPFWLSPQEVSSLDLTTGGMRYGINPGYVKDLSSLGGPPNPMMLAPIVMANGSPDPAPTIAAIEYGSGRVVFTSGFIGGMIEIPVVGWHLRDNIPESLPGNANLLMANSSSLRFAYNVVAWAGTTNTLRQNYRHAGASLENMGAPLINKWNLSAVASADVETSPVIWKNVIFYSAGNTLYAVDASPEQDLDMDGSPDDGERDTVPGVDVIWKKAFPGKISSPTVASMVDPTIRTNMVTRDFVLVTCNDEQLVHILHALPNVGNRLSDAAVDVSNDLWECDHAVVDANFTPFPPVVQNGWIYAAGSDGCIHAYSPIYAAGTAQSLPGTPKPKWKVSLTIPGLNPAKIKSAPTLTFIRNKNTGAVAQMLSVVADAPVVGGQINDSIFSLPIFVSSDRLRPEDPSFKDAIPGGAVKFITSFPSLPIAGFPKAQVWALDGEGNEVDVERDVADVGAVPGRISVKPTVGTLGPNVTVYASYSFDYSRDGLVYTPESYQLDPKWTSVNNSGGLKLETRITATPAIGPNDASYFPVEWPGASGGTANSAVYSVYFDGNVKSARLKWSYLLHGGGTINDPTKSPVSTTPSVVDLSAIRTGPNMDQCWGIYATVPNSDYPVQVTGKMSISSTPAVTAGRVFVTATSSDGPAGVSKGFLLCFNAAQDFVIRCNRPFKDIATGRRMDVKVWQPDLLFTTGSVGQPALLATSVHGDMVDYETGTITIHDFARARILGPAPNSTSVFVPAGTLSPSLPVWVFLDNQPIPLEQIDFSGWNNLIWSYDVRHPDDGPCSGCTSSPVVIGNFVYFTCDDGYMYAVDQDASPMDRRYRLLLLPKLADTDPGYADRLKERESRVPMCQAIKVDGTGMSNPVNAVRTSPAGCNGVLAIASIQGLSAFSNPITLVTDNRRVMEVGGDGKLIWACDSVYEPKVVAGGKVTTPGEVPIAHQMESLNKPLVAHKFGGSDYLVVDSGNDRVIRMDKSGQVLWSLKSFEDPNKVLRSGEPRTLKAPSDARTWGEFEKINGTLYYVSHCLVVDTGNFRIVDIIDRYTVDENSMKILAPANPDEDGRAKHELNWVSQTSYRQKQLSFNSIQLVSSFDSATNKELGQVWASVSNYGLETTDGSSQAAGGGHLGGAIVALNYRDRINDPSDPSFEWNYRGGEIAAQMTTVQDSGKTVSLSGPRYFSVLNATTPELLICDSSTVYKTTGPTGVVDWKLTGEQYASASRMIYGEGMGSVNIPFSPMRAQLLPGGKRLLVVNGYAGRTKDARLLKFTGEVMEIDIDSMAITWYAPEIKKDGADFVQQLDNAPNFDQPTCAQRAQ